MRLFDWKNENTWPSYLGRVDLTDQSPPDDMVDRFTEDYSHVKVYHACRPFAVDSYYSVGILPLRYSQLISALRKVAREQLGLSITTPEIRSAVEAFGAFHDGRVFVVLDDEDLLWYAGHYAIYGSEYVQSVVNHIREHGGDISREHLKMLGQPTVFIVHLPICQASPGDVAAVVGEVNNALYRKQPSCSIDFTFELSERISPDNLVGHYHPRVIRDPIDQFRRYVYKE